MDVPQPVGGVKVLLDVSAVSLPLSGIGRYALELARHLPQCPDIERVTYLCGGELRPDFDIRAVRPEATDSALRRWLRPLLPYKLMLGPYRRRRARRLAARLDDYSDHVFHSPNFSLPPVAGRAVATVHDLSVFHFPGFHPRDRVNYLRDQISHTVERADHLVVDSEFVRAELLSLFRLPAARVTAIALGVDAAFRPQPPDELQPVLAGFGLEPGGYLLSVGTIEPRKNLELLLRAHAGLDPSLRKRRPLVIAGAYGWNSHSLMKRIEALRRSGEVVYLDYVPEQALPALYAGAAAFCYFSHYEGFGLPVLEAMACGVPVACASGSALDELCGGVALQSDPGDVAEVRAVLERAITDRDWRAAARADGPDRAAGYRWDDTARRLAGVFAGLAA